VRKKLTTLNLKMKHLKIISKNLKMRFKLWKWHALVRKVLKLMY